METAAHMLLKSPFPQHRGQQCGKDGGSRQDRPRLLNDGSNQPAKPQQSGQRRASQQGGWNRGPQFPTEGPEEISHITAA